jgi:hypothetical protein
MTVIKMSDWKLTLLRALVDLVDGRPHIGFGLL